MNGEWIQKPTVGTSVVFVHGILSSGETAWRNENGTYWPDLLKREWDGETLGIYAARINVSYPRINEIINGKRGITPDTALRFARLFGTTAEFWLNGQRNWDLWHAMRPPEVRKIRNIEPVEGAA